METNYHRTAMLDMVFENRNKAYGAYVLRSEENKSIRQAMLIAFSSVLLLLLIQFINSKWTRNIQPTGRLTVLNVSDVVYPAKAEIKPVEPPKPKESPKGKPTIQNTEMKIVRHVPAADSLPDIKDLNKFDPGLTTNTNIIASAMGVEGGKGSANIIEPAGVAVNTNSEPIRVAEVMPVFPGGEAALRKFLAEHTEFPRSEREMGIGGRVIAEFTVNEDGRSSDIKILKSPSAGFDREVVRVVKMLPPFKPGLQHGTPVKVRFVLPFTFEVKD